MWSPKSLQLCLWFSLVSLHWVSSYRILVLCGTPKSHMVFMGEAAKALVKHGHQVTMVTGSTVMVPKHLLEAGVQMDYYHLDKVPFTEREEVVSLVTDVSERGYFSWKTISNSRKLALISQEENKMILNDTDLYKRMQESKFDLAFINKAMLPFYLVPYKLGIPHVMLGSECPTIPYRMPYFSSYVPNPVTAYSDQMNLWQKTVNVLLTNIMILPMVFMMHNVEEVRGYAPEQPPATTIDLMAKSLMCFRLRSPVFDTARPLHPNTVDVGGLLGRPTLPLPKEIEDIYTQSREQGVIIVSFGSWLNKLPQGAEEKFLRAFAQLPQTVIWKYTLQSKETPVPPTVKLLPWLPQNDMLAHPSTRLLITHCGLSSVLESVYHGIPILGFPIGLDQEYNAMVARHKGYALTLGLNTFTPDDLVETVRTILGGDIPQNIKKASETFQDLPDAKETLAYWTEHLIKHGGQHLRPQVLDLSIIEFLMVDVAAVILILTLMVLCACRMCCRLTCRCLGCRGRASHPKQD